MTAQLNQEQATLADTARRFLATRSPEQAVRLAAASETGFDAGLWHQLSADLGLAGLMVPAEFGGADGGFAEVSVVLQELGRTLACVPYFSSVVLAQTALLAAGDAAASERWLPGLATGAVRATVAFREPGDRWPQFGRSTTAVATAGRWSLTGSKAEVIDGHTADVAFVFAHAPEGLSLFAVESDAAGLAAGPMPVLDRTRRQARLELHDTPGTLVGAEGGAEAVLDRVLMVAAVATAIEQFAGAERALEMAVDYAKKRTQFGRPIGSFQAIKNKCVDMFVMVQSSRVAAWRAAHAVSEDAQDLPTLASLAKAYCSDAYWSVACENIQVHGGIGFTWEHPAHLYYRRALSSQVMFGTPRYHRELLARRIGV